MLKLSRVSKYYDDKVGIEDVSFEIKPGQIYGFIGPNGSGKSTTIRTIMKYLKKNSGEISVTDKKNIGYLPSEINLYEDLNVLEMIKYNDNFYDNKYLDQGIKYAKKLNLDLTKNIKELSLGNLKKLGIVLTLMHDPKLIILDEPTSGLDPLMQDELIKILKEEKEKGKAILFSSHNLVEIRKISDIVGIIENGKIVKVLTIDDLMKNEYMIITIFCKDIKKQPLPLKDMMIKVLKDDEIKFVYKNNINELIKILSTMTVDKILIEEVSLEDIFLDYYRGK